jgi:hypothetical protein
MYYNYVVNNESLERVNEMRDLGVIIDNTLSWNSHIKEIVSSAYRVLYLIKRSIGFNAPVTVKRQLYLTMVRSKLDYCSTVWAGLSKANCIKVEKVQRSATRYILGFPDLNYKERLSELNLLPLTYRLTMLDINLFYKIFHAESVLNINNYVTLTCNNLRTTRSSMLETDLCIPFCKTTSHSRMYFNRIVKYWNLLPTNLRSTTDISVFKRLLLNYFKSLFNLQYDCNNTETWFFKQSL